MHGIRHVSLFRYCITSLLPSVLGLHLAAAQASAIEQLGEAQAGAQSSQGDVRNLEPRKPIEREIAGGESHSYEIALVAGQYLNAIVDHRGIDVLVTVIAPDGKQIFEFNSESRKQGQETVTLVAEATGDYRLSVQAVDKKAAAGRYEIRVAELRAATEQDRALQQARKLFDESDRLMRRRRPDAALPLDEQALAIIEKALGPDHLDVGKSLERLAFDYFLIGDFAKAASLQQRALAINEKLLGPDHPSVATSLNNTALIYREKGDYTKAEPLFQRSLAIRERSFGPDHPDVAQSLNNLAVLYNIKGDNGKAESLYQRALVIREKLLGPDHPSVATSLNNLALLYFDKGDYAKSEPLHQRALAIREKSLGPDHRDVATSLNNLALLYKDKGDYTKAEPLYQRAMTIFEKALGPDHPTVAESLDNLAVLYMRKGDYAKAEPLLQRALGIKMKSLGPDHSSVGDSLGNLANLYNDKGDYTKAEPLYQRAMTIFEKALGPDHPDVVGSLSGLAELYSNKGEYAKAVEYLSRAVKAGERNIALNIATGSERQKLLYLATLSDQTNQAISLHVQSPSRDAAARNLAVTTVSQRKGRGLDAMTDSIAALRRRANPQDRELIDQLTDGRSRLSKLVLGGLGTSKPAEYQAEIRKLEEKVEELEASISRRSAEFRAQSQAVTLESIQAAIPKNAVLVEFVSYRPTNAKSTKHDEQFGEPRYVVYVLRNQGEPAWVELGESKAIDSAIDALRQALRDPNRKDVKQLARAVQEKVFHPVRRLLGNTRRVLLSPDGALNLIPFAALVDERDQYLLRQYSFSYLSSGRDLLRLQVKTQSKHGAMVVADPDFGGDTTPCLDRKLKLSKGAVDFSQVLFCPLSGTAGEAEALQALMPDATVLTKEQATEAAVKKAAGPKILHIATHGFFLEDVVINPAAAARGVLIANSQSGAPMRVENPLLRSGLALAGANLHKSGDDDGVLTALEAAGLDLWGTKLVVLSACDTGVGEVKNGDGVYGLRRALVLAGSESQVMSLWPVSDTATRDLMIDYYTGLQAGRGRGEALRQVQLRMLASKNRQHPYYWASFIQSGEWAKLDGKR
ncbi:MAG: tetratricopeptide repeat protein [Acidobacteriota bacterium]